jgi:hypothetical protein
LHNIPTVIEILQIEREFATLLYEPMKVSNTAILKDRIRTLTIVGDFAGAPPVSECSDETSAYKDLLKKLLSNLALEYGLDAE